MKNISVRSALCLLLAAVLCLTTLPVSARAEEDGEIRNSEFGIRNEEGSEIPEPEPEAQAAEEIDAGSGGEETADPEEAEASMPAAETAADPDGMSAEDLPETTIPSGTEEKLQKVESPEPEEELPVPEEDPVLHPDPFFDGASNEQTIFAFLTGEMGFNTAAACGILASIACESSFDPHASGDSGSSYGIIQWHAERFTNLKNYCAKNGYDYTTLEGQLHFLQYELQDSYYSTVRNKLRSCANTADGAYQAGYDWCYYFERPGNTETVSKYRGNLARDTYWPKYAGSAPTPIETQKPEPVTLRTVTFDACGGSTAAAVTVTPGAEIGPLPSTAREGFQFTGWYSRQNGSGEQLTAYTVITQDVTYYACWIPLPVPVTSFTVSYDAVGGTGAPLPQTKTAGELLTLTKTKPSRAGYVFLGWAETAGASAARYQSGDTYGADKDITLYAVWGRAGDADGDGAVTCADAASVLRGTALASADITGDGSVTHLDAVQILRRMAGLS